VNLTRLSFLRAAGGVFVGAAFPRPRAAVAATESFWGPEAMPTVELVTARSVFAASTTFVGGRTLVDEIQHQIERRLQHRILFGD
jgi:hypothetical protein